jgi:branched-chain amino acid transport system substrate-binding protein
MVYIQWQKDSSGALVKQVVWPAEGATAPALYPIREVSCVCPAGTQGACGSYHPEEYCMNAATLASSLVDGLLIGVVYGIAAMGLNLIWGVMRVINLAHGAIIALGMFGVYLFLEGMGLNPYLALALVAALGLLLGILIYQVAIARVINAPHLSTLLATFAVNMIIIGLGTAVFTTTPRDTGFSLGRVSVGPLTVQGTRLVAAVVTVAVTGALYFFLYRTRAGKNIRAVANNRAAAELMGINSSRMLALSFGIGTMLAAIAGGLIATFFSFTILSGGIYEQKSFVISVLGGLGNPLGALLGGLILGVLEGLLPLAMPNTWVPVIEFLLFIFILLIKPSGLLGGSK